MASRPYPSAEPSDGDVEGSPAGGVDAPDVAESSDTSPEAPGFDIPGFDIVDGELLPRPGFARRP